MGPTIKLILPMILLILLTFASFPVLADDTKTSKNSIVFLNWSEYMDPDLIKRFETQYNATVNEVFFETDETKEEMLIDTDAKGFDIVLSSGLSIPLYIQNQWLAEVTQKKIPNLKNIDPGWMNVRPEIKAYAVPYIWGTIGIAYRKDLIKKKLDSWMDLFKPETRLRGKIVMINDSKDIVGAGLKALGYSLNSETLSQYDEVRTLLHAQKPYVFDYSYVVLNKNSALIKGDIWMAMVYNGDGLVLQEQDPRISFVAPREGTNLWVDYLVILKHAKNKVLAAQFINFLNEPENAAQLSEYLMFATPNKSAMAHISAEYKNNKMIYPDEKILKKSEVYKILSPRVEKFRHIIFAEVAN